MGKTEGTVHAYANHANSQARSYATLIFPMVQRLQNVDRRGKHSICGASTRRMHEHIMLLAPRKPEMHENIILLVHRKLGKHDHIILVALLDRS